MKKTDIKKLLRERTTEITESPNPHVNHVKPAKSNDEASKDNEYEKVVKLLDTNDIINHAAIVRRMKGAEWSDNSEATNRSKFRKKLKKMTNDEGGAYMFNDDELTQIQKTLMGLSSTITHSLGRQGK